MLKEDELARLVAEFRAEDEKGVGGEQRRKEWWGKLSIREHITEQGIDSLTEQTALELYRGAGWGAKLYPHSFLQAGVDRIKNAIRYLIYSDEPVETRFYNVVDPEGRHKVRGVGREFASFLLCMTDPHRYAIWNGAVDAGLKALGMSPERTRGEHDGERYRKIIDSVDRVRKAAGLDDLQTADEFIELVAHGFIGKWLTGSPPPPSEVGEEVIEAAEEVSTHTRMQWMLIQIGVLEGHEVWVASNDRNREYGGQRFADLCLPELPHFAGPAVLRVAQSIDAIWFRKNTARPERFFEVESTTSIYSGLLRLNDVRIDYPIPACGIVGPREREGAFDVQIGRRTFDHSGLREICRFYTFEEIEEWYNLEKRKRKFL